MNYERDVAMERLIHVANAKGFEKVPDNLHLWSLARHTYDLDTIVEVLRSKLSELPAMDFVCVDQFLSWIEVSRSMKIQPTL